MKGIAAPRQRIAAVAEVHKQSTSRNTITVYRCSGGIRGLENEVCRFHWKNYPLSAEVSAMHAEAKSECSFTTYTSHHCTKHT
jgi:hypothetical protein